MVDRPLSVAGRIIIEENGQIKDQLSILTEIL